MRILGIDLAWGASRGHKLANETGVVAIEDDGRIVDAGWQRGIENVIAWMNEHGSGDVWGMIDAPLVIPNAEGQRLCENEVGRCYGANKVSANSTNRGSLCKEGEQLCEQLKAHGWHYNDGRLGPKTNGRILYEVYPYTFLVGVEELEYKERPVYKRKPKGMKSGEFYRKRARTFSELVQKLNDLKFNEVGIDLSSNKQTNELFDMSEALKKSDYKHKEDLLDAVICAWTGLLWLKFGTKRCQVLGSNDTATIIGPMNGAQRRILETLQK
jgi:predicted RNase H-like nuclease